MGTQSAGSIRYEVVREDVTGPVLHAYLPENFTSSDVELSFDSKEDGHVAVYFDRVDGQPLLGHIALPGYTFPAATQAKYSKKLRRYTLKLQDAPIQLPPTEANGCSAGVVAGDDVDDSNSEAFHDANSDGEKPLPPSAEEAGMAIHATSTDAVGAGTAPAAADKLGKDAEATVVGTESGNMSQAATADSSAAAADAEKKKAKKKKKKKKKGGAGVTPADGEAAGEKDGDDSDEPSPAFVENGAEPLPAAVKPAAPKGTSVPPAAGLAPTKEAAVEPAITKEAPAAVEGAVAPPPDSTTPASTALPLPMPEPPVDVMPGGRDFFEEPLFGHAVAASEVPATLAALSKAAGEALGPTVFASSGPYKVKGEDAFVQQSDNAFVVSGVEGTTPFSVFGVFDGHGGRAAATYCAKHLVSHLEHALARAKGAEPTMQGAGLAGVPQEVLRSWGAQEAVIERLPKALYAAFDKADELAQKRCRPSGSTATLAVSVGWELLVANVGDSCAYLDTGALITEVTANHRVDENSAESVRIKQTCNAKGEYGCIAPAKYAPVDWPAGTECPEDNKEAGGPLRVWPGGLAMTRTIGDYEAGPILRAVPEVRQISIPHTGARLVIASDGAWDAVEPRKLIPQLRDKPATAAAAAAIPLIIRQKKTDDITVLVIDFCPLGETRVPSIESTALRKSVAPVVMWHPLGVLPGEVVNAEAEEQGPAWRERLAAHRQAAVDRAAQARALQEATDAAAAAEAAARAEALATATAARTGRSASAASAARSGSSTLYHELLDLKVDLSHLSASSGNGWTPVGGSGTKRALAAEAAAAAAAPSLGAGSSHGGEGTEHKRAINKRPGRIAKAKAEAAEAQGDVVEDTADAAASNIAAANGHADVGASAPTQQSREPERPKARRPVESGACLHCGEMGHRAAACSKGPGACHTCHQPGHRQSECPSMVCHRCKQVGHRAAVCPNPYVADAAWPQGVPPSQQQQRGQEFVPKDVTSIVCFNCNEHGHRATNCPKGGSRREVCQHWQRGNCERAYCMFLHVSPEELAKQGQPLGPPRGHRSGPDGRHTRERNGGVVRDGERNGGVDGGSNHHPGMTAAAGARGVQVCRDFAKGVCTYGARCRFAHNLSLSGAAEGQQQTDGALVVHDREPAAVPPPSANNALGDHLVGARPSGDCVADLGGSPAAASQNTGEAAVTSCSGGQPAAPALPGENGGTTAPGGRRRGGGGSGGARPTDVCRRCQQLGHFASACPNAAVGGAPAAGGAGRGRHRSGGAPAAAVPPHAQVSGPPPGLTVPTPVSPDAFGAGFGSPQKAAHSPGRFTTHPQPPHTAATDAAVEHAVEGVPPGSGGGRRPYTDGRRGGSRPQAAAI